MKITIEPEYEKTLSGEQNKLLKKIANAEILNDFLEDIGRDSTTDPERLHSAEEHFNSEEYIQE